MPKPRRFEEFLKTPRASVGTLARLNDVSNFLTNRAPAELIYAIFQSLLLHGDIDDAIALSLTCSSLRNHWVTHRGALLWDLCVDVPHAQEALLAVCPRSLNYLTAYADSRLKTQVRITRQVVNAQLSGRLPPMDISPGDLLSGSARSPKSSMTVPEYEQVRALNLLARTWESMMIYDYSLTGLPADRPRPNPSTVERGTVLPEEPSSMPEWSHRWHLAFYRSLIITAGLAGAYHEPVMKARDPAAGMSLILEQINNHNRHPMDFPELTAKEVDWLEQFAVCNMNSSTPEAEEVVFGRIAEWLLRNILEKKSSRDAMAWRFAHDLGRATYCRRLRDSGRECPVQLLVADSNIPWTHADAHLVPWGLMQVFFIFQVTRTCPPMLLGESTGQQPSAMNNHPLNIFPTRFVQWVT